MSQPNEDAGSDRKTSIWMPLYIGEYVADTMTFTTEQHGAYMLLLMACWKCGGELPTDDESLESITKLPPARWRASKAKILAKFILSEDGSTMTQKRTTKEIARAIKVSDARSKSGVAGAAKRWRNDGKRHSKPMANAMAKGMANASQSTSQNDAQSQSQSHTSSSLRSEDAAQALLDSVPADLLADYRKVRTAKKAGPITATVVKALHRESGKAGLTLEQAITVCCEFGWQGFQSDWYSERLAAKTPAGANTNPSEPGWRTEQRQRTQQAAPGVAVKNSKDFFIDAEVKNGAPVTLDRPDF